MLLYPVSPSTVTVLKLFQWETMLVHGLVEIIDKYKIEQDIGPTRGSPTDANNAVEGDELLVRAVQKSNKSRNRLGRAVGCCDMWSWPLVLL